MSGSDRIEHLPTGELIQRLRRDRPAGPKQDALRTQFVLAWRLRRTITGRVGRRVPAGEIEDIVSQVVEAAGQRVFRGQTLAEFAAWLNAIARNKICDFHRARARSPELVRLSTQAHCEGPSIELSAPDPMGAVEVEQEVDAVLAALRPDHQHVIRLGLLEEDLPAREVAERIDGMTSANVHQILCRFRRRLEDRLSSCARDRRCQGARG
jgi:RNA polymerase sigma factor (sigma-70 family)